MTGGQPAAGPLGALGEIADGAARGPDPSGG